MESRSDGGAIRRDLAELIRAVYLGSRTGLLEIEHPTGRRRLYFSRGQLYLPAAHPLAVLLKPHLSALAAARSSDGSVEWRRDPQLADLMARIAHAIHNWRDGTLHFRDGEQHLPQGILGPLPTSLLVMEQAVAGLDDEQLRARLGGEDSRLRSVRADPHIARVACLAEEDQELLARLQAPHTLGELLAPAGADTPDLLRRLCALEALGLLERRGGGRPSTRDVTGVLVGRFAERIAEGLESRAVDLDPEAHRQRLADLLSRLGDLNHYQLLEIAVDAPEQAVLDAFDKLAREVHPSHAETLELAGREGVFEILFERATEAYLTLSDPRRRAAYDRSLALDAIPLPGSDERRAEKRELARRYYRQALQMAGSEDFHFVVELLKQAVRQDPQPAYYALMGQVQARNPHPNWLRQAADNLDRALQMGAQDLEVRITLAEVHERLGHEERARDLYHQVLERMPGEPRAVEGLERLQGKGPEVPKTSWWRRFLGGEGG